MDYARYESNSSGHVANTHDPEKTGFHTDAYSPSDPNRGSSGLGFEEQLVDAQRDGHTVRGLKSRHIQLIALGGAIGTGLFVGSGATLASVGPADFFMAFAVMSVIIWCVTQSLAEMTTWLPVPGASVPFYINRFWDPSLAFASGWNYWYTYAILVAAEISAASIVIDYWTTKVPVAVWITILLIIVVLLNVFAVKFYGEAEFWFASIKIIALVVLIITGIVIFFGGGPDQSHVLGFHYWKDPGSFNEYLVPGSTGRFLGFWHALVLSGFAFVVSPELVAITAGESEAPRRNIPKAASRFVYRLAFFYCVGSLVISVIVPYNNSLLLSGTSDASASPFVIGIQLAGIPVLNHIVNAVILTSATSAANSFVYAASRNLYSLACTGQAPSIFKKCTKGGVPIYAVALTAALACLVYLSVASGSAQAFEWFLNLTTISGFIAWITLLMAYTRFHTALKRQNSLQLRPYQTFLQPYTTYFALGFLVLLTLTNGFQDFFPGTIGTDGFASKFLAGYITIPAFLVLYIGHKIYWKVTTGKWLWVRPIEDVDVWSGKAKADEEERNYEIRLPRNTLEKIWMWLA